jgi:hypothetical protein
MAWYGIDGRHQTLTGAAGRRRGVHLAAGHDRAPDRILARSANGIILFLVLIVPAGHRRFIRERWDARAGRNEKGSGMSLGAGTPRRVHSGRCGGPPAGMILVPEMRSGRLFCASSN